MKVVEPIRDIDIVLDIADYLKIRSERDYVLFMFGIYTGLRICDILKLRIRDVRDKDYISITQQKTDKNSRILIHDELKNIIKKYIKDKNDFEYLFSSRKGKNSPIRREQAYRILKEAANAFGLDCIGCHTLRKTFGYFLYKETNDIVAIKELFNHSDIGVTLRYIGMNQDKKDNVVKKLSFKK
jgi:integrase